MQNEISVQMTPTHADTPTTSQTMAQGPGQRLAIHSWRPQTSRARLAADVQRRGLDVLAVNGSDFAVSGIARVLQRSQRVHGNVKLFPSYVWRGQTAALGSQAARGKVSRVSVMTTCAAQARSPPLAAHFSARRLHTQPCHRDLPPELLILACAHAFLLFCLICACEAEPPAIRRAHLTCSPATGPRDQLSPRHANTLNALQ